MCRIYWFPSPTLADSAVAGAIVSILSRYVSLEFVKVLLFVEIISSINWQNHPRCSFHQRTMNNKLGNRILVVPIIIDMYASVEILVFETHFNIVKAEVKTFESSKLEMIRFTLIGMIIRFAYRHCSKFHGNVSPTALPILEIVPLTTAPEDFMMMDDFPCTRELGGHSFIKHMLRKPS